MKMRFGASYSKYNVIYCMIEVGEYINDITVKPLI